MPMLPDILHTVHTSCHLTLQHHDSYNRTDNYRQWNTVGSPDDGHLVGLSFTYLSKMHGHSNIKDIK